MQKVLVGASKLTQAGTADLLLSFDQEGHATGQRSMNLSPCPHRPQTCNQIALVVGHPACIDTTIPKSCIERWHAPVLQRLSWLDIELIVYSDTTRTRTSQT